MSDELRDSVEDVLFEWENDISSGLRMRQRSAIRDELIAMIGDAKLDDNQKDAERYRYIRDNQTWLRFDDHAVVGCRFPYEADFQAKPMMDYHIDKAIDNLKENK